jgi:excisionase family DNA binding protein
MERHMSTVPRVSPRLITTTEAAELLRVSPRTVLNWIHAGSIPFVELPSSGEQHEYRIPVVALLQSLRGNFSLAEDVRALDEVTAAAGVTDEDITALTDDS